MFASVCTWYSGYLLVELIPDAPFSSAVHSLRSFRERPVLQGQCQSIGSAARLRTGKWVPAAAPPHWMFAFDDAEGRRQAEEP